MGGKTTKTSQTTTIPPDVLARYNSVNAQAQQAASTPFQTYSGQFVAPLNDTQNAGIANTNAAATQAQPGYQSATGVAQGSYAGAQPYNQGATAYALAGGNAVNPNQIDAASINKFMNPYLQDVLGSTSQLLQQNNAQAQSGALGSAIQSGAFGGDRAGIAAANLQQQQNLANANIYSNIASQGFNTALGAAQQQQGVNLSADQANRAALQQTSGALAGIGNQQFTQGQTEAGTEAGLASGAQSAALQGAQAQLQAGGVQQQTQQAQDSALYNQFQQQQSYPFQTAQFLANIAEGTGALSGNTTTGTAPGSIFSDERLKEDIRPIGKTNDGQTIYSYRYKGEQHHQIGLLAQEVEKKHPDAVGLAGGYKTVNYKDATEDSERARRAAGGGLPYGGLAGGGLDIPGGEGAPHQMMQGHDLKQGDQQNGLIQAAGLAGAGKELGSDAAAANKFISGLGGANKVIAPAAGQVTTPTATLASAGPSGAADLAMPESLSAALAPEAAGAAGADALGAAGADAAGTAAASTAADVLPEMLMFLKTGGRAMRADGGATASDDDDYGDMLGNFQFKSDVPGLAGGKPPPAEPKPTGLAPPPKQEEAAPDDIVAAIAKAEGTGKNPKSSARGAFQFTDPTFVGMFKSMFPDRAKGMSDSAIVSLRDTPEGDKLSAAMGPEFTHQNMSKLQAAGHAPTPGNTYLAHFLGSAGALHILNAPADAPLERLLPQQVIEANPTVLKGKRVGDLLNWASNTVGKFMPRAERAGGGRAGFAFGGDPQEDDNRALAAGIDTFAPPDTGGSAPDDHNTVAPVTVKADNTQPTGLKPGPQGQVQEAPQLLNRSLPNVQMAPDPDAKPKLPKDPNIIDGITNFAKNTFDGIGGAATRMGNSLVDTKGTTDENGVHHGPADYIIPILTGLAGMGADRSGSLGGALAAGLGAGASAYQGQREFGQKQQALDTSRMQAVNAAQLAGLGVGQKYFDNQYEYHEEHAIPGPDGKPIRTPWYNRGAPAGQQWETDAQHQAKRAALTSDAIAHQYAPNANHGVQGIPDPVAAINGTPGGAAPSPAAPAAAPGAPPAASVAAPPPAAPAPHVTPPVASVAQHSGLSTNDRAKRGDYSAASFNSGASAPSDANLAPGELNLPFLEAQRAQLQSEGRSDAAARVGDQINALKTGAIIPKNKDGSDYRGYVQGQSQIEQQETQRKANEAMIAQREKDATNFPVTYTNTRQALMQLAHVYQTTDTNRNTGTFADAIGALRSIPGVDNILQSVPGWQNLQTGTDEANKLSARLAQQVAASSGLSGAPAAALTNSIETVANPHMDPAARFKVISTALGGLEQQKDHLADWSGVKGNVADLGRYDQDWYGEKNHSADRYELKGRQMIGGHFAGMTDQDKASNPIPSGQTPPTRMIKGNPYILGSDGRYHPQKHKGG